MYWQNLSLENLTEERDGILYAEQWRAIDGYEELYQVSDFGRVKALGGGNSNRSRLAIKS